MNNKQNKANALWRMCMVALIWMLTTTLYAQNVTVSGIVKDPTGEPVIGASVTVKGANTGTVTNIDGRYTLQCPAKATLVFSYLGLKTKNVEVNGRQQINIDLEDDATALNEVVVTALGIKRQTKALGYAVTELKSDELERANTVSPVTALQGKVAGVEISQSDGGMFGSTKIQIRGASTLNANNQPIFVVDGVILDNATSQSGDADWDSNINDYGNQLKNLNPDDFESVSVLKGAAATALYGSRGLNGAVVITTKSGKAGKGVSVKVSQTVGIETVYRSPDLQNRYMIGAFPGGVDYGDEYTATGNLWSDNMSSFARNSKGEYSFIEQYGNFAWDQKYHGPKEKCLNNTTAQWAQHKCSKTIIKMPTTRALTPTPTCRCKVETTALNSMLRHLISTTRVQRHETPLTVSRSWERLHKRWATS